MRWLEKAELDHGLCVTVVLACSSDRVVSLWCLYRAVSAQGHGHSRPGPSHGGKALNSRASFSKIHDYNGRRAVPSCYSGAAELACVTATGHSLVSVCFSCPSAFMPHAVRPFDISGELANSVDPISTLLLAGLGSLTHTHIHTRACVCRNETEM